MTEKKTRRRLYPKLRQDPISAVVIGEDVLASPNQSLNIEIQSELENQLIVNNDVSKDIDTKTEERLKQQEERRRIAVEKRKQTKKKKSLIRKKDTSNIVESQRLRRLQGKPEEYGFPIEHGKKERVKSLLEDLSTEVDRYINVRNNNLYLLDNTTYVKEDCNHEYQFGHIRGNDIIAFCSKCSISKVMIFDEFKKHIELLRKEEHYEPDGKFL